MDSINPNVLGLCTVDGFSPWTMFKLDENSFVVDLGAHRGEFSAYIIDTYNCRVDAYEPSEAVEISHPKLRVISKPVWDGSKILFQKGQGTGGSILTNKGQEVETVDILEITKEPIDLLKVNIEGAEIEVLKRADLSNVKQLLVEFHLFIGQNFNPPITQEVVDEVVKKILSFGFQFIKFGNEPAYFFYK